MENETITLPKAKYLRLFSDMHLDMYVGKKQFVPESLWYPDPLPEDKESILVLAGDIWHAKKIFSFNNFSWIKEVSSRFQYVFVVLGNHDFWGGQLPSEYDNFKRYKKEQNIENLYLLQNSTILMGDYKFLGTTFWVNYANNPDFMQDAMNYADYRFIRYIDQRFKSTFKKLQPRYVIQEHNLAKNFVFNNAVKDYPEQKLWVISHHPPSFALIDDPGMTEFDASVSANDYDEKIQASDIDVWMHGHNHQSGEALVGKTRIIANTVGYATAPNENAIMNPGYNPWFQLSLD